MTKLSGLDQDWPQDPEYQAAYHALKEGFGLAALRIPKHIETTQSVRPANIADNGS